MTERILTLHPEGKTGVNIERAKYEQMKATILELLERHGEVGFGELGALVVAELQGRFDGAIMWYYTNCKLDLEARGVVVRVGKSPQRIRLVQ